jgi:hypothetical protein
MMPEPHVDDIFYIFKLIVVYNALQKNSKIQTKLPYFVFKHFIYLREKYPQAFPQTEASKELLKLETEMKQATNKDYWRQEFRQLSQDFQKDLMEQINAKSSIKARAMIDFMKGYEKLDEILMND